MLNVTFSQVLAYDIKMSHFHQHGWMDGWIDGWMDGQMDGWMDGKREGGISEKLKVIEGSVNIVSDGGRDQ